MEVGRSSSCTMRDFTAEEVAELYAQHTPEKGQRFDDDALSSRKDNPGSSTHSRDRLWRSSCATARKQ
jgi:hypothetical protein